MCVPITYVYGIILNNIAKNVMLNLNTRKLRSISWSLLIFLDQCNQYVCIYYEAIKSWLNTYGQIFSSYHTFSLVLVPINHSGTLVFSTTCFCSGTYHGQSYTKSDVSLMQDGRYHWPGSFMYAFMNCIIHTWYIYNIKYVWIASWTCFWCHNVNV